MATGVNEDQFDVAKSSIYFEGSQDEAVNHETFERDMTSSGLFHIMHEVRGYYHYLRPGVDQKTPRIDFLLAPSDKLLNMGWTNGAIGVEAKGSGVKIGPVVSQAMDYTRASFETQRGLITPSAVFLYPVNSKPQHDIESVMTSNRIGIVRQWRWGDIDFFMSINYLRIRPDGRCEIGNIPFASGRKAGSR